ncbi:MAG: hypothetical protein FJ278_15180 [Planctomycetes bacterium]|nr:hypothetical protein [Planctomycetota bacterium]
MGHEPSTINHQPSRRWLPSAVLLLAFLAAYKLLGLGGTRSLLYIDPLRQPLDYVRHAATALPVLLSAALTIVPAGLHLFIPGSLLPLALLGLVLWALWLWALWPWRRDPAVRWAFAVFLVALLPQAATVPSERLLYFPFVPASYLLARLLTAIPPLARRLQDARPRMSAGRPELVRESGPQQVGASSGGRAQPLGTRVGGWYVLLGLLLPGAILSAYVPYQFLPSLQKSERDVLTGLDAVRRHAARQPDAQVIVLNTSSFMLAFYVGEIYEQRLTRPIPTYVLSSLNGKVTLERIGPRSFLVRTDRPGWLSNVIASAVRNDWPLDAGRVYRRKLFDATLIELTPDGRDALAVRFDFQRPLDDPSLLFLAWDGQRFSPLNPATLELTRPIPLADTSDVWKSMK